MSRIFFFVALCLVMFQFTYAAADFEDLDSSDIKSLSSFDGVENDIFTPLNTLVPKLYFRKDISSTKSNEDYHASFELAEAELNDTILYIRSSHDDNLSDPVVISIKFHGNNHRNYIVEFGEETELYIALDLDIEDLKREMEDSNNSVNESFKFKISIFRSSSFHSEISTNGFPEVIPVLEPDKEVVQDDEPSTDCRRSARRQEARCCVGTSGQLKRGIMTNTADGASGVVWVKIHLIRNCESSSACDCYSYMTVYWPTTNPQDILLSIDQPTYTRIWADKCQYGGSSYFYTKHMTLKFISSRTGVDDFLIRNGFFYVTNTNGNAGPFTIERD